VLSIRYSYTTLLLILLITFNFNIYLYFTYRSNNCTITTNRHVSQIRIFPRAIQEDYFYLCVSMTKHKIVCAFGVKTYKNDINTSNNVLTSFIFCGKFIIILTILCVIIIIKKIK